MPARAAARFLQERKSNATDESRWGNLLSQIVTWISRQCSEAGVLGRSVSTNAMAISAVILLAIYLLIYY
jgi:hypothetical protein